MSALAVHEGEDLAVCHQVVLALDALEDGRDNSAAIAGRNAAAAATPAPQVPPSS